MGEIRNSDWSANLSYLPLKLIRFGQINFRDSNTLLNLYPEQFSYGHREILLDECGLDFSTQLIGNLQHGIWDTNTYDFRSPRFIGGRRTSTWVFSKNLEMIGRKKGFRKVYAIGAPWLYLKRGLEEKGSKLPLAKKKVLVINIAENANTEKISQKGLNRQSV